jgi:PRTRC genetic system protein E
MFQELMPLLAQRLLLLTLSRVSDEQISINVIPKPLKSDQSDDDGALTTPLSVTGTPRDLDEQLPGQLVAFVEAHLGLSSTLKSAKEQMENAGRAAKEAARKSTASKSSGGSSRSVGSKLDPNSGRSGHQREPGGIVIEPPTAGGAGRR